MFLSIFGKHQRQRHRCRKRCHRGQHFYIGRGPVHRVPQGDRLHEVCAATSDDECPECQKHPMKRDRAFAGPHQIDERQRDHDIRRADQKVKDEIDIDERWIAKVAKDVRHELHALDTATEYRPD